MEWKLNDIPISSYPAGSFVTTRTGNTHILHVVRAQTTLSGHYTCELKQQLTELAATSQNVTIRPGEKCCVLVDVWFRVNIVEHLVICVILLL